MTRPRLQGVVTRDVAAARHHLRSSRWLHCRPGLERFRVGQGCGCHRSERAAFGRSLVANVPQRSRERGCAFLSASTSTSRSIKNGRKWRGSARLTHDTGEIGRGAQHHLVFNPGGRQTEIGAARNHAIDRDCIGRTASAHHHQPVDRGSDQMGRAIASGALYPDRHFLGAQRQPRHLRHSAGAVRHRRRGVGLAHRMLQSPETFPFAPYCCSKSSPTEAPEALPRPKHDAGGVS
jgi:hypothetical protein